MTKPSTPASVSDPTPDYYELYQATRKRLDLTNSLLLVVTALTTLFAVLWGMTLSTEPTLGEALPVCLDVTELPPATIRKLMDLEICVFWSFE